MTYDVNNKQQEMAYQLIKDTNVSFFLDRQGRYR